VINARHPSGANPRVALALTALLAAGCAGREAGEGFAFERPETAVDYAVELSGAPSEEIDALLRESLGVFRRQEDGAQSLAFLRRRALEDVAIARRVLRAFGYYEADMAVAVEEGPEGEALARLTVEPGRRFTLLAHRFVILDEGPVPVGPLDAASLGSPVGGAAEAQAIIDAEIAAVARLRGDGRPYAEAAGRDAVADLDAATIEVDSALRAGPFYVFGDAAFEGLRRVEADYLLTYQTWEPGETFSEGRLAAYQRRLVGTRLFAAVSVRAPETPPEGEAAPVIVSVQEGKRRSVSAGVRFNTDDGPAVRGTYEDRNLFGRNETLLIEALAGLEEQRLEARYRVPQYRRDLQDFVAGAGVRHIEDDAFDEVAFTLSAGLERQLTRYWRAGAGGLLEITDTTDFDGQRTFTLAGLPLFAAFDDTDDLLDPTKGWRFRADVIPFAGVADSGGSPLFTRIDSTLSTYYPLDEARRYVLAGRTRLGAIPALDADDVPAGRRLYSGGGGSVRGYRDRFIGPLDARGDPVGGRSVVELGAELRALVAPPFGLAAFVEGGAVSEEVVPVFDEGFQTAAGLGLRYLSPVGPIRVDVGVPLNKRREDDDFQIYLSIGQAF
jgi:translocation and assembly module TamA